MHEACQFLRDLTISNPVINSVTAPNIKFDTWAAYLGDAPLAMALLDRVVDKAVLLKIVGKSYRAARAIPTRAMTSSQSTR
jgi:hypothetical protein